MKLLCTIVFSFFLYINTINAQNLDAFFSYCTFNSPVSGPYIETYLSIKGSSLVYLPNQNAKKQGSIEVVLVFKKENTIENFKKYNLLSPEITDSTFVDFVDQQRISLPNGKYNFEIQIKDNNSDKEPFKSFQVITIEYPKDSLAISKVELISSYKNTEKDNILSKSGYDLVPFVSDFYDEKNNTLTFYAEIYNSDKKFGFDEKYLVTYFVESFETGYKINDLIRFSRQNTAAVSPVLGQLDLKKLGSGNYNLVIEIRDRTNSLIKSKRLFFQRLNPSVKIEEEDLENVLTTSSFVEKYQNVDTLSKILESFHPIASQLEKDFIGVLKKTKEIPIMQRFMLKFWKSRNPVEPGTAWDEYRKQLIKVDKLFKTQIKRGYQTARGRVWMQYGAPDVRLQKPHEPSAYPYEIWHYYNLKRRKNVKFVFFNRDMGVENYELLHSSMYGEYNNPRWRIILEKRNTPGMQNLDITNPDANYGSNYNNYFDNPR